MKQHIPLKSALRQPAQTLFLLLLIAAISFAFIARAVEYIVVNREAERLGAHYRAVGYLEGKDIDANAVAEAADIIARSSYVAFEDRRSVYSGVMHHGLYNSDRGLTSALSDRLDSKHPFGLHLTDLFLYGTLVRMEYDEEAGYGKLAFVVDRVEEGHPAFARVGKRVAVQLRPEIAGGVENTKRILESLKQDARYFFKPYYDHSEHIDPNWLLAKPLNDEGLFFYEVQENELVDFTEPALVALPDEIEVLRQNTHTVQATFTKDMSAMPHMQQSARFFHLARGRWLSYDDHINLNPVCMISSDLLALNNLSVGDKLTLTLRDMTSVYAYISDEHLQAWRAYPIDEGTFEIVGVYGVNISAGFFPAVYIPYAFMPKSSSVWQERFSTMEELLDSYSFVLDSSKDIGVFLEENREAVAQLGLNIVFVDSNAEEFWKSAAVIQRSTIFNAQLFSGVLLLALLLATFVYLRLHRREFAISRALGRPKASCIRQMLGPMALTGGMGILIGGIFAWDYAREKAIQTLEVLQEKNAAESSAELSVLWLGIFCAAIFIILIALLLIGARVLARRPVLELLQGTAAQRRRARKNAMEEGRLGAFAAVQMESAGFTVELPVVPIPISGKTRVLAVSTGYVLKHARRAPLKSALTLMLALCFTVSLGWIDLSIKLRNKEIDRLYASTEVGLDIVSAGSPPITSRGGFIAQKTVDTVLESGFVQSCFLEAELRFPKFAVKAESSNAVPYDESRMQEGFLLMIASNDADTYSKYHDGVVEYMPGYDASFFLSAWRKDYKEIPLVVDTRTLEVLGAKVGDTIYYIAANGFYMPCKVYGKFPADRSSPMLTSLSAMEYLNLKSFDGLNYYQTARFELDPTKNRELPAFKERIQALVKNPQAGLVPLSAVFWDEDLTNAVAPMEKNLQLLSVLFPVTVALSAVIAAGLSVLLLLQSAKEAAVLRVLGNTRRRVWAMLCAEQLLLTLLGLILGLAVLALVRSGMPVLLTTNALLCALIYLGGALLGSVFTAASVVRKMPIALLQVKE